MRVCVFCSSSEAVEPRLLEQGERAGRVLAQAGHEVVYGGTRVGTMGRLAAGARAAGGRVTGVLPRFLAERDIADEDCDELVITDDLLERKRVMLERSDAFVALPGGLGTLDEVLEAITHVYLGQLVAPIVLLDDAGFWARLWSLLEDLETRRLARAPGELLVRCETAEALPDALAEAPRQPRAVWRA